MTKDTSVTFKGMGVKTLKDKRAKDAPLFEPVEYHPRPLGDKDVEIAISHCGMCASDIHTATEGWGPLMAPAIVGHEIVGHVKKVGKGVSKFKVNDRVGVGCFVSACFGEDKNCKACSRGKDNHCSNLVLTYNAKYKDGEQAQGGYADGIRVEEQCVFLMPKELENETAAPLLCAGTTTFTPMVRHKVGKGHRVGIIGVGGLGHLAIQFAHALGAYVVSVSTSDSKKADALKLGADEHLSIKDEAHVKKIAGSLDYVFCTANAKGMNWDLYLSLCGLEGTFCLLAVPEEPIAFRAGSLIFKQISLCGSLIGSVKETEDMLKFAAKHNIKPMVEVLSIKDANTGYEKMENNDVKYRVVLKQ